MALVESILSLHLLGQKQVVREDILELSALICSRGKIDLESSEALSIAEDIFEKIKFDYDLVYHETSEGLVSLDLDDSKKMVDILDVYLQQNMMPGLKTMQLIFKAILSVDNKRETLINFKSHTQLQSLRHCHEQYRIFERKLKDAIRNCYIERFQSEQSISYDDYEMSLLAVYVVIYLLNPEPTIDLDKALQKIHLNECFGDHIRVQDFSALCEKLEPNVPQSLWVIVFLIASINKSLSPPYQMRVLESCVDFLDEDLGEQASFIFQEWINTSVLSKHVIGRILCCSSHTLAFLPDEFQSIDVLDKEAMYGVYQNEVIPADFEHELLPLHKIQFVMKGVDSIEVRFVEKGKQLCFKEDEEQRVGQWFFVFKPSQRRVYFYTEAKMQLHLHELSCMLGHKNIFKRVNLSAKAGELVGVVGASGCGKSTLLMALAGLVDAQSGQVLINGRACNEEEVLMSMSTYINQDDILFRELSVRESVENAASLMLRESANKIKRRVDDVLEYLHLEEEADFIIGDENKKGISGGQRKRVGIATSIVAGMKPIMLFDEPNSGLDTSHSRDMVRLMRIIARRGHLVFASTHDLTEETIQYFDKILVLTPNGDLAYFGEKDSLLNYFKISKYEDLHSALEQKKDDFYVHQYKRSHEGKEISKEYESIKNYDKRIIEEEELGERKSRKPSLLKSLFHLLWREHIRKIRDQVFLLVCLCQPIVIALILCWDFSGPSPSSLFALVVSGLWIGAISGVREVNSEIPQLRKDYRSGVNLKAYGLAKWLSCFSFVALQVIVLSSLFFIFMEMGRAPYHFSFFPFLLTIFSVTCVGLSIGLFLSVCLKSPMSSLAILPLLLIPLLIKGGLLFRHNQAEGLQHALVQLNPVRLSFEMALLCGDKVLAPSGVYDQLRNEAMADQRLEQWKVYQEKLSMVRKEPEAYKKKYGEVNQDRLLDSILNPKAEEKKLYEPSRPPGTEDIGLLMHHRSLWLKGYSLYSVDRPKNDDWSRYGIKKPSPMLSGMSVQAALGFYQRHEETMQSTLPLRALPLIVFIELVSMMLASYLALRIRLKWSQS